jgi:hypothetical protein
MTTLVYGHTVEEMPSTVDAKVCAESLFSLYQDWQLRRAGQYDRIVVCRQRLEQAIKDENTEEISRIRLDLRQAQHLVEKMFGVRYAEDDPTPVFNRPVTVRLWS